MAICYIGGMKKDRYESLKNGIKWLRQAISQRKKEVVPLTICAVLVMVTVINIVKIIQIRNAEARQAQEALALQEEFVSESGDDEPLVDETDTESADIDAEGDLADDPNAWYYDIDVDFAGLKEQNEDIVGWIYFEDEESISYPLLYSGDDYYLRRNYLKENLRS